MRRALLIALAVLAGLAALGGGAFLWLTAREEVPARSDFVLDLAELRRLATSLPGPGPLRVRSQLVARTTLPRAALFAGQSFTPHPMVHQVFQLEWSDRSLLIDTAFPREALEPMGGGDYDDAAFARVVAAMGEAEGGGVTH